jgi:hypothetical protein
MRKLRWISILLLVVGAAALGYKLSADWRAFHAVNDPAAIKPRPLPPAQPTSAPPAPDYTVVSQQNPFHPERNDAMPPPPAVVAKSVAPPPLVYGSMLLGKEKYALMATENDLKPRKVNEGEDFNGYKLAEVKPQSVVLESEGAKSEVMFYNALSRLRRENAVKTQAPPPTVQTSAPAATAAMPTVAAEPALPPANSAAPAPAGKKLVMTPFGPIWQDVKQ